MANRANFCAKVLEKGDTPAGDYLRQARKHKTPDRLPDQGFRWGQGLAPDLQDRRVGQVIQERLARVVQIRLEVLQCEQTAT
jgi:hypothetical protein